MKNQDQVALGYLAAGLDRQLLNHASHGRRHLHGSLVRFKRDQRIIDLDGIPGRHVDFDHIHIREVANIRDTHFEGLPGGGRRG